MNCQQKPQMDALLSLETNTVLEHGRKDDVLLLYFHPRREGTQAEKKYQWNVIN